MILKMKTILQNQQYISLKELSISMNLSMQFTQELLRCLIEKGKVKICKRQEIACKKSSCGQCFKQDEELYVWQEI